MLPRRKWYFVCEGCSCKFFYRERSIDCPRCGERLTSHERQSPPWRKRRKEVRCATRQASSEPPVA